jgi:hypothetical protein
MGACIAAAISIHGTTAFAASSTASPAAVSLRPSARTAEAPIPMWFDVLGNGVTMLPLQFHYDLETSRGQELVLGTIKLNRENFNVSLRSVGQIEPHLARLLPREDLKEFIFLFRFPRQLMTTGTFEMISRTGRVLWSQKVDKNDLEFWQAQLEQWKTLLLQNGVSKDAIERTPGLSAAWGLRDAKNSTPLWRTEETFRFCYTDRDDTYGYTRLCTPYYEVVHRGAAVVLQTVPRGAEPVRVIYQNQEAPQRDIKNVEPGHPVQFYAELSWGSSYEFNSIPEVPHVIELTEESRGSSQVRLVAEGVLPLADYQIVKEEKVNSLQELLGLQETIGDFRRYWSTTLQRQDPVLMIPGTGGGAFMQRFEIKYLPREELRPYLNRRTVKGTYHDGVKVFGSRDPHYRLRSKQNSVVIDDDPRQFTWRFGAKKRGEMNRSYLLINDQQNLVRAYHEIYKGYPFEISARLSAILGTGNNLILMGELMANYWFEDLFGWSNYYLSRQRWGLSAQTFQAFTNLAFVGGYSDKLQVTTLDLRYRLNPGLWGRDETWGLTGSYQQVKYNIFKTDMLGAGVFWARSMPKVFDDLFNILPFMRYPKWVDLDFIYYLQSRKPDYPLRNPAQGGRGNWSLNFHGQIMWTKQLFGEAGFGIKNYDFNYEYYKGAALQRLNFNFTSFYGTAGIGYRF